MTTETPISPSESQLYIHGYAEDSYLQYAMAVVKARALVQVQDGLKPVHRRILFAMKQLGLTSDAKPVKSARIVGDVLGKYHPHGDSAAYDAMVRMAQPFAMRYPLISGQGNFGSRDGDSAAAMRYTEARLAPISKLLLDELGMGTVDFMNNYDGSQQEPVLLPARLPFTLLNGTMGIAVGMASNMPPHNLREVASAAVAVLENPALSVAELMEHLPGPDFPDGGQIVSSAADLRSIYETGKGSLRVRARWTKEELSRGQWQIVVNELPYLVSTKQILGQLDTLTNPQPPEGKKHLTQQQLNLKALALDFLENARDESDKDAAVRLVLIPRNSKVDPEAMLAFLLANTSLEDTYGVNSTVIGLDGRPSTKGILQLLSEWGEFRLTTVRRRTQFELDQAQKRIHLLEGRLTVFLNLDEVVRTIREADEPKAALIKKFGLSDIQAEDILEMRLRQLNRLEGLKLEKELDELRKLAQRLVELLDKPERLKALVIKEIREDSAKYGDDRRTLVKEESRVAPASQARNVLEEPITVVVSKNLWVKAYKGIGLAEDAFTFKSGDSMAFKAEGVTTRLVAVVDTKGRAYSFAASDVPTKGEGAPLSTFIELQDGAKPAAVILDTAESVYLFAVNAGYGFLAPVKSLWARPKAGKAFVTLLDSEQLMPPVKIPREDGYVISVASNAKLLAFSLTEVKARASGGRGIVLMALDDGDTLVKLGHVEGPEVSLTLRAPTGKPFDARLKGDEWLKYVGKRARKGTFLPKKGLPA